MNVLGNIWNAGENVEGQEYYRFTESFFKISPTIIDDIIKNKLMKIQLWNLRTQRDIENIDKWSDERNRIYIIDYKEYD